MEMKKEKQAIIPIVMAFDPEFLLPAAATMISVIENGSTEYQYNFYILCQEEHADMDQGLFKEMAESYPNFEYEYRLLPQGSLDRFHLPVTVSSHLTFARLFVDEQIADFDACIYIDGDLIARRDLADLWTLAVQNADFNQIYLAGCPDLILQNGSGEYFDNHLRQFGFPDLTDYFNAGVLVMNLKKLREDHMTAVFLKAAEKPYMFGDQDILNICCRGRTMMLPIAWNMIPNCIDDCEMTQKGCTERDRSDLMKGNAAILHFAGEHKPWTGIETRFDAEWYSYAKKLAFGPLTEPWKESLKKIQIYDPYLDRMSVVAEAKRCVIYGFTGITRKLLDRLRERKIVQPWCFCDNNKEKQGIAYQGIASVAFEQIAEEIDRDTVVIIGAQTAWREVREELLAKGVRADQIVRYREYDFSILSCGKEYHTGLLMGVFDLFHIGHLNLICRAKSYCDYLRIGVLADELVYDFKGFYPTIPQEERMQILSALKDVDEVLLLETREDVSRLNEWKKRPFDCFFSGDDYAGNEYWEWEKQELRKLGSDIHFFPYTEGQSSTMIREALKRKNE